MNPDYPPHPEGDSQLAEPIPLTAQPAETKRPSPQKKEGAPFSEEYEFGFIACLLNDPRDLMETARDKVPPECFYTHKGTVVYGTLLEMSRLLMPIDVVTVSNFMRARGELDGVGGPSFISELFTYLETSAHFDFYAKNLNDLRVLRDVIHVCTEGIKSAKDLNTEELPVEERLDVLQREIMAIKPEKERRGPVHVKEAAVEVIDGVQKAIDGIQSGNYVQGMPMGFADLDRMTNGLERGDRVVIGAHSSTGKTTLLMAIARNLLEKSRAPGLIFSNDGLAVTLARRLVSDMSGVDNQVIRTGIGLLERGRTKQTAIARAVTDLQRLPLFIDDRSSLTMPQLCSTVRRMVREHGVKWIAADFFQNYTCPGFKGDFNRVLELEMCSKMWMNLILEDGLELDFGIMLAQLNREKGERGRPTQHNIKNCGKLYEDASKVMLLSVEQRELDDVRENEDEIPEKDRERAPALELGERLIVCDVNKNKDGPTGPVWLRLWGPKNRFRSFVPDKKIYASTFNAEGREAKQHEQEEQHS